MRDSVHDNEVYAQTVDYERCRIVLHTVYPPPALPEFTDVVFDGVTAFHFERPVMAHGPNPANILFDVTAAPARDVLAAYRSLLESHRNYGWPVVEWADLDDLVEQLTSRGASCYEVHSSYGLGGFVFAARMEFRPRAARAQVAETEPADAPTGTS